MICTYYLSDGVSMVTETSGTRTGTLDSEYENIGIIPIYFVFHCPLGLKYEPYVTMPECSSNILYYITVLEYYIYFLF